MKNHPIAFELGGYDKTDLDISVTNSIEALETLIKISSRLIEVDIAKEDILYLEMISTELERVFAESEQFDDIKMQAEGNLSIAKRKFQEAESEIEVECQVDIKVPKDVRIIGCNETERKIESISSQYKYVNDKIIAIVDFLENTSGILDYDALYDILLFIRRKLNSWIHKNDTSLKLNVLIEKMKVISNAALMSIRNVSKTEMTFTLKKECVRFMVRLIFISRMNGDVHLFDDTIVGIIDSMTENDVLDIYDMCKGEDLRSLIGLSAKNKGYNLLVAKAEVDQNNGKVMPYIDVQLAISHNSSPTNPVVTHSTAQVHTGDQDKAIQKSTKSKKAGEPSMKTKVVEDLLSILNSRYEIEDNQLISAARKINAIKITNAEISKILFSFRNLDSYILRRAVIDVMTKKIDEADGEMNSEELIRSISGLRNLDSTVVSRALMNSLARKINESNASIDAKGIGIMTHSLKNLDSLAVTHKFTEALHVKLQDMNSKLEVSQITKCLTGIGNLSPTIISGGFIKEILGDINEKWADFGESDILTILNGLINYTSISGISEIINILFLALEGRWQKYEKVKNPRQGVQIYNLYSRLIPVDLENSYEDFVENYSIEKSKSERRAVEIVRNVTSGMYIEENKHVSGFEMDIFLPRHRLNIEIDGPQHYSKKPMDLKRDRHLFEAKMITVHRVNLLRNKINGDILEILNFSKIPIKQIKQRKRQYNVW